MRSEVIMYQTEDGTTRIETTFDGDTVWLSMTQMAELFQRDKSTVSRHLKNIFTEGELERSSVVAEYATTAADGKTYQVDHYNLDVIISVGYRVRSLRGTQSACPLSVNLQPTAHKHQIYHIVILSAAKNLVRRKRSVKQLRVSNSRQAMVKQL